MLTMRSLAALVLFAVLAIAHTWPLASDPGVLSRNDNGDTILIEWTLAWDAHQVVRAPWNLFEANIFYPSHDTLAFSEHLFTLGMMGAPFLWSGLSPVLVYNLLILAGLALSGWSLCLVVWRWTGDWLAGTLAGSILAFNAHTLTRLPHLHALHYEFLPPALLVLDALLTAPRLKHGVLLAAWFLLMALTSNYHMVFALAALAAAIVVRPMDWRLRGRRLVMPLALAAALSGVAMVPFLLPYLRVRELYGAERTLDMAGLYIASINDYLATASRLHYEWWSEPFVRESDTSLFPGVIPVVLGLAAIGLDVAFRDLRARMALAVGAAGFLLSFGPALPGYAFLYNGVPLLQGIRGVNRFGFLVIFALAVLSGFVVAHVRQRLSRSRWVTAVALLLVLGVNVEALRAPMGYVRFEGIPQVYDSLAREEMAVIVELPFHGPRESWEGAAYMLYSTRHWHPIANGHSAFIPPSYRDFHEIVKTFPDASSLEALSQRGVTHVVVHDRRFKPLPDEIEGLSLVARRDAISLYRVVR
jgi:hypothetical protein